MIRPATIQKYIGLHYGRYTIKEFSHKVGSTRYYFVCECECGVIKTVLLNGLKQGTTVSCGCYGMELRMKRNMGNTYRRLPAGVAVRNTLLSRYKGDAKSRKISFNLGVKEFSDLTSSDCFYCGSPPSVTAKGTHANGVYIYNGIDRVDNSLGYEVDNCVPCCKKCNSLKNGTTIEIIEKAYEFLSSKK